MLLRTAPRSWLGVGLLALGGCGEFTLVEPPPAGPVLSIHVSAISDQSTRYALEALFRPGRDTRGEPTQVTDRALYVDGTPVLPETEPTPGTLFYRWQHTPVTTGDGADPIHVAFPVIANSSPSPFSTRILVPRRQGSADVDLTRGEDLVLRISSAGGTPELSGRADSWLLEIRQSCSGGEPGPFMIQGRSPHPSELRVPWQWLETLPGGPVAACFRALSSSQVVGSPYPAFVSVSTHLVWRINVAAPGM